MGPMRTPDEDGTADGSVGDGFGPVTEDDLNGGFGDDDFSEDNTFEDDTTGTDTTSTDSTDSTDGGFGDDDGEGDTPFGDGLSDAEAENVLVEILEDVFGDDAPEVLDDASGTSSDAGDVFEALTDVSLTDAGLDPMAEADNALSGLDDGGFDPFEPAEIPSESDFDFTGDGQVDGHDLHEASHPFDFGITQ